MLSSKILGIMSIVTYTASMALLNLCVKLVHADVHTIMFARYNITLLLVLPFIYTLFRTKCSIYLHILRGIGIFAANFFTYYGHKHASFFSANVIGMTEPFFVLLISLGLQKYFQKTGKENSLSKELLDTKFFTFKNIFSICCGYIGVLILIFHNSSNQESQMYGNISILLANLISASFLFFSRYIALHEKLLTIIVCTTLTLWCCGWLIKPDLSVYSTLQNNDILLLICIGFIAISGHVFAMFGLNKLTPEYYAPLLYTRIIFGLIIGSFIFNETFTFTQICGTSLIIFGLFLLNHKSKK